GHGCAVDEWPREGTDGFLGHDRCQGQTCGAPARRPEALLLMGGGCGVPTADTPGKQTGRRLRPHVGGVCQAGRHGNKWSKVVEGAVWPLARSLLMGAFPILPVASGHCTTRSGWTQPLPYVVGRNPVV